MSSRGRREVIKSVLAFDRSLDELKAELSQFAWDCDEPLVFLTAEMMTSVLDRFLTAELNAQQLTRITEAIQKATGKQVEVKVVIDPTILGGVVTTVGDTVIDGSVRTRLEQLKNVI